jgi:hypothetical protein
VLANGTGASGEGVLRWPMAWVVSPRCARTLALPGLERRHRSIGADP